MREMADWIGARATLQLIAAFGGTELYVPMTMPPDHPVVEVIGLDAARKLSEIYGRERLDLPAGRAALASARRASVLAEVAAGRLSKQEAARQLHTSTRYVRQLLNEPPRKLAPGDRHPSPRSAQLDLLATLED